MLCIFSGFPLFLSFQGKKNNQSPHTMEENCLLIGLVHVHQKPKEYRVFLPGVCDLSLAIVWCLCAPEPLSSQHSVVGIKTTKKNKISKVRDSSKYVSKETT